MKESSKVKIWLSCPEEHTEALRLAIGDAGIGQIGNYSHCSFVTKGKGLFQTGRKRESAHGREGEAGRSGRSSAPIRL